VSERLEETTPAPVGGRSIAGHKEYRQVGIVTQDPPAIAAPVMFGMSTSVSSNLITELYRLYTAQACRPSSAVMTLNPSRSRYILMTVRIAGVSSTTRIVGLCKWISGSSAGYRRLLCREQKRRHESPDSNGTGGLLLFNVAHILCDLIRKEAAHYLNSRTWLRS
jgi:hypothetical protein